jgi:energy-converting hydrogenase A subunit R
LKRVFITDCEGPVSKNDNAFEILSHFVPEGDKLFTVVSRYDDALSEVLRRPGYTAGDTLKLVVPFLKAYDVTDRKMKQFSANNIVLMPNARYSLQHARSISRSYIVSTSYEHYIEALCQALEFPFENTYCTKLRLDKYSIAEDERRLLKKLGQEIANLFVFEISAEARSLRDLSMEAQKTIGRLDEIFWKTVARMRIGEVYSKVNPVGGTEKAEAIEDITRKDGVALKDVMYVGDSITDEKAFRLVKQNGGLTVSFNGNQHAVRNAEIALLSTDSLATALVADVFLRFGKSQTLNLVAGWSRGTLQKSSVNEALVHRFLKMHPRELPKARIITRENMEDLASESEEFRKKVRGEAVGRLG